MKVNFEDTQVAFASKSIHDLRRAYLLFYSINFGWLVAFGTRLVRFALSIHLPIRGLIKSTLFKQFCGGENIADCSQTSEQLWKYKIGTILDYSVEGKETEESFEQTKLETIATIEKAAVSSQIPFCVFKTTGLGSSKILEKVTSKAELSPQEQSDWLKICQRVHLICKTAHSKNVRIFIDAEETWLQGAIDQLAVKMMREFNTTQAIVYNTYQMYISSKLSQLKDDHKLALQEGFWLGAKLVRGAYMEKERERAAKRGYASPIQPDKASTDRDYNASLVYCIENQNSIAICAGSHNEASAALLVELMQTHRIEKDQQNIYFSQLYGMSDHISFNLSSLGYNVAKYVPYGPVEDVLPYLFRRAEENTSVKGQSSREFTLVAKEFVRRKKAKQSYAKQRKPSPIF